MGSCMPLLVLLVLPRCRVHIPPFLGQPSIDQQVVSSCPILPRAPKHFVGDADMPEARTDEDMKYCFLFCSCGSNVGIHVWLMTEAFGVPCIVESYFLIFEDEFVDEDVHEFALGYLFPPISSNLCRNLYRCGNMTSGVRPVSALALSVSAGGSRCVEPRPPRTF